MTATGLNGRTLHGYWVGQRARCQVSPLSKVVGRFRWFSFVTAAERQKARKDKKEMEEKRRAAQPTWSVSQGQIWDS